MLLRAPFRSVLLPRRPALFFAAIAASLLLAGCGTTRSWLQKSSGHPATFGTSVTLPLPGSK